MKRILITGASGGLGRSMVRHLQSLGTWEVYTANRSVRTATTHNLVCDLACRGVITGVLEQVRPELILNLAADFGDDFKQSHAINFCASAEILHWVEQKAPATRVLLIGTAAEYGAVLPEENPIAETRRLTPVSIYGMTKACQSQLLSVYAARKVDVLCARLFNLRGEGLSERMFVGRVARQIQEIAAGTRRHLEVGPLSATRDFIHIKDAINQLMAIVLYGKAGEIYHIASGYPMTMRELLYAELTAHALDVSIVKEAAGFSNRPGFDVPIIYADIKKTQHLMDKAVPTHG